MRFRELLELIEEGESTVLEFKRKVTRPIKIAREIAAFANTKGGYLLVGVDDDGSVVGVHSEKSEVDIIERACGFFIEPEIKPEIEIINVYGMDVVSIYIAPSNNKPHMLLTEDKETKKTLRTAYIRIGEKSVTASREMTRLMNAQRPDAKPLRLSIGDKEKRLFAYLERHERATVNDFSRLCNISKRRAERLMVRLVRAGVLQIHNDETRDYFSLV